VGTAVGRGRDRRAGQLHTNGEHANCGVSSCLGICWLERHRQLAGKHQERLPRLHGHSEAAKKRHTASQLSSPPVPMVLPTLYTSLTLPGRILWPTLHMKSKTHE
jgi:hypothetical protein